MVKVIMGLKGSGKTKQLIESINTAIKTESGSMICIEKGNKLTFDIDYRVRLIESSEYQLGSYTFLKGFISGLHAGNFDISDIFIDSLYKIACSEDIAETEDFLAWCDAFGAANNMKFTITISADINSATEGIKKYF
jgi:hypothetical protein